MENTRKLGPESFKSDLRRIHTHFYDIYMRGKGIDIGYKGNPPVFEPVLPDTIGIDLDTPGYDGRRLPFPDQDLDYVYASHTLEHITDYKEAIREWYRVLKIGGYLIVAVPHQYLYEKSAILPSKFNEDHKRLYTPACLLFELEEALPPNSFRLRHCQDCDFGFDYTIPPEEHSGGDYQIECVIQKIKLPTWKLRGTL
jgi:SAM-dependent methyltransferase